jgi:glycerol-3-phosphate acyltransferase PlsY
MIYLLAIILAYLIGSFPSGVVVVRIARGIDVRRVGSRRSGATNVFRAAGVGSALVVFLLDVLKGAVAVWLGMWLAGSPAVAARWLGWAGVPTAWPLPTTATSPVWAGLAAGLAAIAGHNWPIYVRFRGGRGVSTTLGTIIPLSPLVAGVGFLVGASIIILSRYASLGSLIGCLIIPAGLLVQSAFVPVPIVVILYGALVAGTIIFQHRDNIARLRAGTERKLGTG